MKVSTKGLVLLGILISAAGVVPAFAATNSTMNMANSTMAATSYGGMSASNSTMHMMTNSTVPSNLPPPPHMLYNSTNPGQITSMGGAAPAITVMTDKLSYNDGDKITISGKTRDNLGDTPLTVIIRNPVGNVVKIDQVPVSTDNTFSTSMTSGGALWQAAGTYSVYVQFGGPDRSATLTFQFAGSSQGNTFPVDGTNVSVKYSITNGKVLDIKADTNSKSLIVTIQTTGDGALTIDMPRSLIDAKKTDGTDDQYFVLNDGQENDQFQETSNTATDRTLQIPFTNGTSQIEIIGTMVVPEFGPIAALVLAVAIISIIAISTKTGLRFTPKI
ncbi:MAG: PEFG-CTERM sorting domain-containing protein [Thaumarchaeota archaeon]|nr:PEFG-CTERM sorting domain-containing protein [Nitrososphaerota archaeon]